MDQIFGLGRDKSIISRKNMARRKFMYKVQKNLLQEEVMMEIWHPGSMVAFT